MAEYNTPGVYVEEISPLPPSVQPVETAVPAFIGYTEFASGDAQEDLTGTPVRIASLTEFAQHFGREPFEDVAIRVERRVSTTGALVDFAIRWTQDPSVPRQLLPYAMRLFFDNGGGPCYVYSLGTFAKPSRKAFTLAINALGAVDEPTLLVFPGAVLLGGNADYGKLVNAALASCSRRKDRFTIADVRAAVPGGTDNIGKVNTNFRDCIRDGAEFLKYGAAYFPYLRTAIPLRTADDHVTMTSFARVVVDAFGKKISSAPERGRAGKKLSDPKLALQRTDSVAYDAINAFLAQARVTLPPSAAVAGVYAQVDNTHGVWKAPANVSVSSVSAPAIDMNNAMQDDLNIDTTRGKSVNTIRAFPGKGTLVWGARTLAGNDNEWRYVNVRRFAIFLEESVSKAIEQFVFEPNDANTWVRVRGMIENFLVTQWRNGALMGAKPEHAFYVRIGLGQTMTAADIANGRLIVEVGIAAVRPAEFIVLRILQKISTP